MKPRTFSTCALTCLLAVLALSMAAPTPVAAAGDNPVLPNVHWSGPGGDIWNTNSSPYTVDPTDPFDVQWAAAEQNGFVERPSGLCLVTGASGETWVFGSTGWGGNRVYRIDAEDGSQPAWLSRSGQNDSGSGMRIALSNNGASIYHIDTGDSIRAYPVDTDPEGEPLWSVYGRDWSPGLSGAIKVGFGNFIYGHWQGSAAIEPYSQTRAWWTIADIAGALHPGAFWVDDDEDVANYVVAGRTHDIVAYNLLSYEPVWVYEDTESGWAPPTLDPETGDVYVFRSSRVIKLNAEGALVWESASVGGGEFGRTYGALSRDRSTYYYQTGTTDDSGRLYAFNTSDGSISWTYETHAYSRTEVGGPVVTANGLVFVGNAARPPADNMIYCIEDSAGIAPVLRGTFDLYDGYDIGAPWIAVGPGGTVFFDTRSANGARRLFACRYEEEAGEGFPGPDSLTESDAVEWGAEVSSGLPVFTVGLDSVRVAAGSRSVHYGVDRGTFSTVWAPSERNAQWDLSDVPTLQFRVFVEDPIGMGFENSTPAIRLYGPGGYYEYQTFENPLIPALGNWMTVTIPLEGDCHWARRVSGSPDLSWIEAVEFRFRKYESAFEIWIDGLEFGDHPIPAPPSCPPGSSDLDLSSPADLSSSTSSNEGLDYWYHSLACDDTGNCIEVWASSDPLGGTVGSDKDILFARSADGGETWSAPAALMAYAQTDNSFDVFPGVATDGEGTWLVVWSSDYNLDGQLGDDFDILVSRSTDNGATWSDPIPGDPAFLSDGEDQDYTGNYSAPLSLGEGVWLLGWYTYGSREETGSDIDVALSRSSDDGLSWSERSFPCAWATTDSETDYLGDMVTDGNGTVVLSFKSWSDVNGVMGMDADILFLRSSDFGMTWGDVQPAGSYMTSDVSDEGGSQLDWRGDELVCVWRSEHDPDGTLGVDDDVFAVSSFDGGITWNSPATVNSSAGCDFGGDTRPTVSFDPAGNLICVWETTSCLDETIGTDSDLAYATSTDGGLTWTDLAAFNTDAMEDGHTEDDSPHIAALAPGQWGVSWRRRVDMGENQLGDNDIVHALATMPLTAVPEGIPSPARIALEVSPNPFNPTTTITFVAPNQGLVEVTVYDLRGQRVRTLHDGLVPGGLVEFQWDGRDDGGRRAASGAYLCRVAGFGVVESRKVALLK